MDETAAVTKVNNFLTRYTLPGGPELLVRRAKNNIRRLLVENPDERMENMLEAVSAAVIAELKLPADYSEEYPEGKTFTWDAKDLKSPFQRFDQLDLLDQQAYHAAWREENLPTRAMVEAITAEIKKAKEAAKGKA